VIGILDYGVGNLRSIQNMLARIGEPARTVSRPEDVAEVERLVLPGVGAFDAGIQRFTASGLREAVTDRVEGGTPILGICLGMQMLGLGSEEGVEPGLGWIQASAVRFRFDDFSLKVPHMGWSTVEPSGSNPVLTGEGPHRFYFLHSYHVVCEDPADVIGVADYGGEFTCAVGRGNVLGVQFHPEKSHRHGMALLGAFARMQP
jgi:glutamine amidotransferase